MQYRKILCATFLFLVFAGGVHAGRLFGLRTADTVGENDLQLRADWVRSAYREMYINRFALDVNYGVANGWDLTFTLPLYTLGGISDSLVIGDIGFDILFRIKDWLHPTRPVLKSLFGYAGFLVGVGLGQNEGKMNPDTGLLQTYYPFVNGLSQVYLGVGYAAPLGPLTLALNLEWFNETRDDEGIVDFKFQNDHVSLRGGLYWYTEGNIKLFGKTVNVGFKPFYEANFRITWSMTSGMPQRMDNVLGVWLRLGQIFRVYGGYSLSVKMDSNRFLDGELFLSFAAVFR